MSPHASLLPARQAHSLFWWWLAVLTATVQELLLLLVPSLVMGETTVCAWMGFDFGPEWKVKWFLRLWRIAEVLSPAIPVTLVLCIWLIVRRGADRPRVHRWTALTGVGLISLDYALGEALPLLDPLPESADCSVAPESVSTMVALGWTFAPAVFILMGAWTGLRSLVSCWD